MNIKESIFDLLRTDYNLRKLIADSLSTNENIVREGTVGKWAYRKQHAKVGNYMVVNIIKQYASLDDSEIFETETVAYQSTSNN